MPMLPDMSDEAKAARAKMHKASVDAREKSKADHAAREARRGDELKEIAADLGLEGKMIFMCKR